MRGAAEKAETFAGRVRPFESLIRAALSACAVFSILTSTGIVAVLASEAAAFFALQKVSLWDFIRGTVWQPTIGRFGILPLLNATLMTSCIAMSVAAPLGFIVALYLSEYAPSRLRNILKPTLELLAGIPTIVYGFFALGSVTPFLRRVFGADRVEVYNTLSAGLVMGLLIVPLISSMCEDALSSVPRGLREAAYAVGATKREASLGVIAPAAFSGIAASFILALSRAIGETMIVALAAGSGPNFTLNPFKAAETMTGHIVRISGGDLSYDSAEYKSLFAIAMLLFIVTLCLNMLSRRIVKKYGELSE